MELEEWYPDPDRDWERYLPIADYLARLWPHLALDRRLVAVLLVPDHWVEKEEIAYTMLHGPQAPHYNAPLF